MLKKINQLTTTNCYTHSSISVEMLHLHLHLHQHTILHKNPLFSPPFIFSNKHKTCVSEFLLENSEELQKSRRRRRGVRIFTTKATEKDSGYEVDPEKARRALKKLDEQLQSLSQRKPDPPKIRASDMNLGRRRMPEFQEEAKEFTTSDLVNTAVVLFLLTIFYNVIFLAVIKPAIDGPETYPETELVLQTLQAATFFSRTSTF